MVKEKIVQLYGKCFLIFVFLILFPSSAYTEDLRGNFFKIREHEAKLEYLKIDDLRTTASGSRELSLIHNSLDSLGIDISGFWTGQVSSQYGAATMNFYLIQSGSTVTGTWESSGTYPTKCGPWTGTMLLSLPFVEVGRTLLPIS